jgi:4-amino-4-deoxy-L-arabinose transferase-like glycosyltransferase
MDFPARRPRLALALFCLLCWLPGFFTLPPGDRDESRFAQATKQMIETGDYVRIMNGDVPRNRKPIGIHWAQAPFALAARAAGIARANPIWPYRLPSLLGGLVAVLGTFELGALLIGRRAGLLAGAMLAASVILVTETHIAKTDAALLGATTLAMLGLARAWCDVARRRDALLFWAALGAGILLKGPITPMVAGLAALGLALSARRGRWLLALRPGWGVPLLLLIVLPWFVAIGLATHGAFFRDAVGGDLGRKLASGDNAHGAPPGLYLLLLPLLGFPATLPILRALPDAWRTRREAVTRFLLAWAVPSWLVFEAVPTKLPHYTLPLYPALCLLGARWALDPARGAPPRWLAGLSAGGLAVAACVLGVGAAALPLALHAAWWLGLPALAAALLVAGLAWNRRVPAAALVAVPLLYAAVLGLDLPAVPALWIAPRVVTALARLWPDRPADGTGLAAVGFHEPSLMFLAGTHTQLLPTGWAGAAALADGTARMVLVGNRDMAAFAAEAARRGLMPLRLGEVSGFNYSRGRPVVLTLFGR